MHTKNPFVEDYDFNVLIKAYPRLKEFVFVNKYGNSSIHFSDKDAVKALNSALLKAHYNISWDIPANNLCPPIPGRLDYLLHIADLLEKTDIRLLDIGTGANLIYPILATCHFNWQCTASEVDIEAYDNAQHIINNNLILKDTELRLQQFRSNILENMILPDDNFDVVVCNPPFFKSSEEAEKMNRRKYNNLQLKDDDSKNFGGHSNELWCKGGEEAFIKKMAQESVQFKNQVHWFTSLVSEKDKLKDIKRAINKTLAIEVRIVNMEQGNKISRFIAWTFN